MDDLISRQAAIDEAKEWIDAVYFEENDKRERKAIECFIGSLKNMPSAQPERTGRWRHYEGYLTCSECGTEYDDDIMTHCGDDVPKFCPNCGADMRGETNGRHDS